MLQHEHEEANVGLKGPLLKPNQATESQLPAMATLESTILQNSDKIPEEFVWAEEGRLPGEEGMQVATIDLSGFLRGDETAMKMASQCIGKACADHGCFQVINHGVAYDLVNAAHQHMDLFFGLPLHDKLKAQRKLGESCGYANSFIGRFSSKLPWKETLSFDYSPRSDIPHYFEHVMGYRFLETGIIYGKYCQAMERLSLALMELLGVSLGVERWHLRRFFEENSSIMRLNYYPPCQQPSLTYGTGPHCDPTSLTILHQDQVGGLEVFIDDRWLSVPPNPNAFFVNIGDTFMALSNGRYKSCLHRAVVNSYRARKSLAFFLCPRYDRVVRPPPNLLDSDCQRKYHDFTWPMFLEFTQKHYRSDMNTLASFNEWLVASHNNNKDL